MASAALPGLKIGKKRAGSHVCFAFFQKPVYKLTLVTSPRVPPTPRRALASAVWNRSSNYTSGTTTYPTLSFNKCKRSNFRMLVARKFRPPALMREKGTHSVIPRLSLNKFHQEK